MCVCVCVWLSVSRRCDVFVGIGVIVFVGIVLAVIGEEYEFMTVYFIDLRSNSLLGFILFVYSYLCCVELSNSPFFWCGIRLTQKTYFQFMHLLCMIKFFHVFCICIVFAFHYGKGGT